MTVVEWPDRESFEKGYYDPDVQANLKRNVEMLSEPVFLVSGILVEGTNR